MISVSKEWNPKQALLKNLLKNPDKFNDAIKLFLDMHSLIHTSEMSGSNINTYEDELWKGLTEDVFRVFSNKSKTSIAWNLWHITRIEDITNNILITNKSQVFNDKWLNQLCISIKDTGNAMTDEEIKGFSQKINMKTLRNYRISVGKQTQQIIKNLETGDMKRKMAPDQLQRLLNEGCILDDEKSRWLIDFWAKKTVSGIILMPLTRHQVVHLNDAFKIKLKYSE